MLSDSPLLTYLCSVVTHQPAHLGRLAEALPQAKEYGTNIGAADVQLLVGLGSCPLRVSRLGLARSSATQKADG